MSQPHVNEDRERARAVARAELAARAEAEGVKPFDAGEWLAEGESGRSPEEVRHEVDEFLALRRELREAERARGPR